MTVLDLSVDIVECHLEKEFLFNETEKVCLFDL